MGATSVLMETPSDVILTPDGLRPVENAPPHSPWLEVGARSYRGLLSV